VSRHEYAGGASARYLFMGAAVFLVAFGLVMIWSASSISALVKEGGNSAYFFLRQLLFVAVGAVLAYLAAKFDYRKFQGKLGMTVWWGAVGLLLVTYVLGAVRLGARRWIPMGLFNLQPSEFAKIACVLVAAMLAVQWQRNRMETSQFLGRVAWYVGLPAVLVVFQPDLGTAVLMAVGVAIVLFLAGIEMRWIAAALAALAAFGVVAIAIQPYRMARVVAALDPWSDPQAKGYQTVQALLAFGTGGIKGVGLGLSRQKFFYLPEAHTDFIFAIIGEEAGLIGTIAVVAGFAMLLYAGMRIAIGSRDAYGRLVAGALTGMLGVQAVLNMAAVTGVFPVTGKPLPFMSYGGSSMFVTMLCVGIILSVSEYGACAPRAVRSVPQGERRVRAHPDERRRDSRARVPGSGGRAAVRRRA
jgi:cell division protein FtsW